MRSPIDGGLDGEGHYVPRQTEDERDAHGLKDEAPASEPLPRRGQQGTASTHSNVGLLAKHSSIKEK